MADGKRLRRETFFQILLDAHDCLGLAGDGRRPAAMGRRANQNQKREQRHFNGFGHFNLDVGKGFCISGTGH